MKAVLFTASWCRPCKELKQWLINHNMTLEHVDIDVAPDLAIEAGVTQVPAMLVDTTELLTGREEIKPYLEEYYDAIESPMSNT